MADDERAGDGDDGLLHDTMVAVPGAPTFMPGAVAVAGASLTVRERLQLRGLHSSGGIGEVWLAYDELLKREVALKRLKLEQAAFDDNRARFFREARLTSQLDHPGIVPVYDYSPGEDGEQCFYTMRFVRGKTLRELIHAFHHERRTRQLPLVGGPLLQLLGFFTSVCNTMAFAHSRRVIHRDLKGDNIIVGDFGEVVVLDWGLAKTIGEDETLTRVAAAPGGDASQTQHGVALGTPSYMSPEQARGDQANIDERTDVYGLAAILYEILSGQPPFPGQDVSAILDAVLHRDPTPPRELVPGVPRELERVCMRGLARDLDARLRSAAELRDHVRAWLDTLVEKRRSELERERFFRLSSDLLAIVDAGDRVTQSNPAWRSMLDLDPSERPFVALLHGDEREAARAALARVRGGAGDATLEARMEAADGGERWVSWRVRRLPDSTLLYLVGRDISELKRSERRFRGLLESAPDAACVVDERGVITLVNDRLERLFGYPREQLLGKPVELLVPEAVRARHRGHVARYVNTPQVRPMGSGLSLLGQRRDGTIIPVEISLSPVHADEQTLIACSVREVDARRRHERLVLAVLDAAPDAMLAVDDEQVIALANKRAEALFGYEPGALVGCRVDQLIPEDLRSQHAEHVADYQRRPSVRAMGASGSLRARHRDGREFAVEISLSPVATESGALTCCAIRPVERSRSD